METNIVLLQKVRREKNVWIYMVNREQTTFLGSNDIEDSFISVISEIQDRYAANGERLIIVSQFYLALVEEIITDWFSEITFLRLTERSLIMDFMGAFNPPVQAKRANRKTLFIGSDASGGHIGTKSAWAWCTEGTYETGICGVKDNNVSEFEGILRSIIGNKDAFAPRIHVYSDSKNAIDFYNTTVIERNTLDRFRGTYFEGLIREARAVLRNKKVTVEWVKGHKTHRLNGAADNLSRHALRVSHSGKKSFIAQDETDAMFSMYAR
jgi:ribonuclease HI